MREKDEKYKETKEGRGMMKNFLLEKSVKELTKEIESLTVQNEVMMVDLSTRSFYKKYYELKDVHKKLTDDFREYSHFEDFPESRTSPRTQSMFV